jgi:hypothetical protein
MKTQGIIGMALFGLAASTTACATTGTGRSDPQANTAPAMTMPAPAPDPAIKAAQEKAMMADCQAMKQQKQKMAEDMKAQAAALTEHVAMMNAAPKDKKTGVMADVVTQMAGQQIAMDARKARMDEEMMMHMMKHMQMGKDSMAMCPMMKSAEGHASAEAEHHAGAK